VDQKGLDMDIQCKINENNSNYNERNRTFVEFIAFYFTSRSGKYLFSKSLGAIKFDLPLNSTNIL